MVSIGGLATEFFQTSVEINLANLYCFRPGFSLSQALDMLNDDEELSSQVDQIFITPPEVNVDTDKDSADESDGGMIYNLTGTVNYICFLQL